jgi:hypothetical protein
MRPIYSFRVRFLWIEILVFGHADFLTAESEFIAFPFTFIHSSYFYARDGKEKEKKENSQKAEETLPLNYSE